MQRFVRIIFLVYYFVFAKQSFSQDIRAGWINYKWMGGYTYSLTLNLLLDSSTVTTNSNLAVYFGDGDSAIASTSTTSVVNNVIKLVYGVLHTYSGPASYYVYSISKYRVNNIQNIQNSGSESMVLYSLLSINPFMGPNNSPIATAYPIISPSVGSLVTFNPGMSDIDGDSLSYSLVNCASLPATANYIPANSAINGSNGTFTYQADTMGLYAFKFLIKEWRKDLDGVPQMIGTTEMDFVLDVDAGVGIKEFEKKELFSVHPNPASGILNIKTNSKTNSDVEIINSLGQIVLKQNFSESIDISKLQAGYYFIKIDNSYSKFIKEY
jgi:hypothetical protein